MLDNGGLILTSACAPCLPARLAWFPGTTARPQTVNDRHANQCRNDIDCAEGERVNSAWRTGEPRWGREDPPDRRSRILMFALGFSRLVGGWWLVDCGRKVES